MKTQVLEATNQMITAYNTIEKAGKLEDMITVLKEMGYTEERIQNVINFLQAQLTPEEVDHYVIRQAYIEYMNGVDVLEKLQKKIKMAQGYEDMAEINKAIAQENVHLEEEGAKLGYEMDSEESKGRAEAK